MKGDTRRKAVEARVAATPAGFTATITADTLDRDGEVVVPQGMNSQEFERNPILLYNHDTSLPIGKCVGLRRSGNGIDGDFVFAKRPDGYTGDYFPEFVASLVGQGIVKGISIGYAPIQGGIRRASLDDRKRYGDAVHTVFSRWKLLEISVAPVPANPDALIAAIRKGLVDGRSAKRWLGVVDRRVSIRVEVPSPESRRKARKPINIDDIVARVVARARGRFDA